MKRESKLYTRVQIANPDQHYTGLLADELVVTSLTVQSFFGTLVAYTTEAIGAVTIKGEDTNVFNNCTVVEG